jgi:hypothetical protein
MLTMKPLMKRIRARWPLGALALAVALLVGVTVHGLRDPPRPPSTDAGRRTVPAAPPPSVVSRAAGSELADETPPWKATPNNTPALPEGTVPPWEVDPPPPDPSAPLPPDPVDPPNPAEHRPPLHNPGGVNGDRPPRPVPGLD